MHNSESLTPNRDEFTSLVEKDIFVPNTFYIAFEHAILLEAEREATAAAREQGQYRRFDKTESAALADFIKRTRGVFIQKMETHTPEEMFQVLFNFVCDYIWGNTLTPGITARTQPDRMILTFKVFQTVLQVLELSEGNFRLAGTDTREQTKLRKRLRGIRKIGRLVPPTSQS